MRRRLKLLCRLAGILAAASATLATHSASQTPFFKGFGTDGKQVGEHGVGAFYQHQKSDQRVGAPPPFPLQTDPQPTPLLPGYDQTWDHDSNPATPEVSRNWWEPGGGWCGTTAWIDSFYFFDQNGFPGFFDHSNLDPAVGPPFHRNRSWLERFTYANEDLAIRAGGGVTGGCAAFPRPGANLPPGNLIPDYVNDYGYGNQFVYGEYFWDASTNQVKRRTATGDVVTGFATMIDLYRQELLRSEDVLLIMEGTGPWWWSGSFHVVTGAGVETDVTQNKLWFADPDVGRGGMGGWGHPYQNTDPVPDGEAFYTMATFGADGRTFNSGPYTGAAISEIYTLSPVPEPSTFLLLAAGFALLLCVEICVQRRGRSGKAHQNAS